MIPRPYIVPDHVRRIRIQIDKDFADPREQPVITRHDPPVPAHLLPNAQAWRASRNAALNELIELGVSMPSFIVALREMLKEDADLVEHLTGSAKFRAALLRYGGLV